MFSNCRFLPIPLEAKENTYASICPFTLRNTNKLNTSIFYPTANWI